MNETLALATTEELIKELFDRHVSVLLVTIGKAKNADDTSQRIRTAYRGGTVTAIGLCEVAKDTLKENLCDEDGEEEVEE